MRIVLLNQFYPPDVAPTGLYLHELARSLVKRGHEVTVIASRHAYGGGGNFARQETIDDVTVRRLAGYAFGRRSVAGKLADYAAYYVRVAQVLATSLRPQLVVSLTTPPFLGLLGKCLADLRGAKHAHWVMDVYPDVLRAHEIINGVPLHLLRSVATLTYSGAHAVVTLGPTMAAGLRRYVRYPTPISWVPLWTPSGLSPWPEDIPVPLRAERGWTPEDTVLLYSGNFGLGHRFEEFLGAAQRSGIGGPRWIFAGAGRASARIQQFIAKHPQLPVELHTSVGSSRLREHLCSADVHLISMTSEWEGTLLPSKLQASFSVAKPVIFVGKPTLDIARWISDAGAGWVVEEGDIDGLLQATREAQDRRQLIQRGNAATAFAKQVFDPEKCIGALISAILPT